jgi:hypothetical protein
MAENERFKFLIRNISLARMIHHGGSTALKVQELKATASIYSHWMAIILISGPSAKIVFKTHFKTKAAQKLAAPAYNKSPDAISRAQAIDFIREFCNLTAGGIKASLLPHNLQLAISLPVVTRGFDEIFFREIANPNSLQDQWKLTGSEIEVICTTTADFFANVDFSKIDENPPDSSGGSDVEFF